MTKISELPAGTAVTGAEKIPAVQDGQTVYLTQAQVATPLDTDFVLRDNLDITKKWKFQLSGITTSTTRVWTVPDVDDTFLGLTAVQSPTNKTLDNTNAATLKDTLFTLQDDGDATKQGRFQLSGVTTATTRTFTLPDADTTLVGTGVTQSLTNKTLDNTNTITLKDTLFTLQDDGDTTKQAKWQLSGITTATTRTYTLPDASDTVAVLAATQALTNKTYNGNTLTAGTWVLTGGSAKTLTFNNTLTLAGTDGTTMTFPSTTATIARTDAAQTFTGVQTLSSQPILSSLTASSAVATDGSKGLVSVTNTGSGSNVLNTNPTISGNITFSPTTGGLAGTTTNDNATAGVVGELISSTIASGSAVNVTPSATPVNVTSISLTAGDWDVWGSVLFTPAATTNVTQLTASVSTVSATLNTAGDRLGTLNYGASGVVTGGLFTGPTGVKTRISLSGTTTVYLVGQASFTVSTIAGWGTLQARRVR